MTTWENFVGRRRIDVNAFISYNGLTSKELFLAHLNEHGVQSPTDEFLNALFPPTNEVKVEAEKNKDIEGSSETSSTSTRSDTRQGKRDSGAPSGKLSVEDRSGEDTSSG